MEQKKESVTWNDVEKRIAERFEKPTGNELAMEILKHEQEKSKAKNVGVISLTVAVIVIAIGMAAINYKNDVDWRELFTSYDYVTQDGDYNNVNSGQQGDVNNGSESEDEEE